MLLRGRFEREETAVCADESFKHVWETYVRSWKAETPEDRQALLQSSLDPECIYQDPLTRVEGLDALSAYMSEFHRQVPGGHFVTRYFMAYDARSIARWEMQGADGSVLGDGISYAEYGVDGKLARMTAFFQRPA